MRRRCGLQGPTRSPVLMNGLGARQMIEHMYGVIGLKVGVMAKNRGRQVTEGGKLKFRCGESTLCYEQVKTTKPSPATRPHHLAKVSR